MAGSRLASYESLGWMVGHEVRYTIDSGAALDLHTLQIGYYESGYATELTTAFQCDNQALTTLWKKAQRTLYVNMRARNSIHWVSPRICSKTLMGYSDPSIVLSGRQSATF